MGPPPPPSGPQRRAGRGILSEPIDLDGPRRRGPQLRDVPAVAGLVVHERGRPRPVTVVRMVNDILVFRDDSGRDHQIRVRPGLFLVGGEAVNLVAPRTAPVAAPAGTTASGSVAVRGVPARVARASRILVEGTHDAELIEKVWGDDLRVEGVVVEPMGGMDDLAAVVRAFGPRPGRRLGILLDHLVEGTKEWRAAQEAAGGDPNVLVCGHPYVDVWAAVKPKLVGRDAWPEVPRGQPWKEGVIAALGGADDPPRFWKGLLGRVSSYADLEPPLVGAVEQLIDFVTEPD